MGRNFIPAPRHGVMEQTIIFMGRKVSDIGRDARRGTRYFGQFLATFFSRLLQPRDSQKLSFTAPKEPGVYPYVCTYPVHWMRMRGAE